MAHVLIIDETERSGRCECGRWNMMMEEHYKHWRSAIEEAHRWHLRAAVGLRTRATDVERFIREIK